MKETIERVQASPLWSRLEAVRNDRAHRVDPEWWLNAGSVQAANLILDDLEEFLVR